MKTGKYSFDVISELRQYKNGKTIDIYTRKVFPTGKAYAEDTSKSDKYDFDKIEIVNQLILRRYIQKYIDSVVYKWKRTSEKDYWYFLEVLPPENFNGTSFYMCECQEYNMYHYYTKYKGKYYTCLCEIQKTHDENLNNLKTYLEGKKK